MDDKAFTRFTELCIKKARQNETLRDVSRYQIVQSLLLLKTNPYAVINFYTNRNNQDYSTVYAQYTMCGAWIPGCWLYTLFWVIVILFIILPILSILDLLTISGSYNCENPS